MKESQFMSTLAAMLCRINAEVHKLQLLNLHSLPDTVKEMLYAEKGMMITPRGDAYMVRQCRKISSYEVLWNQKKRPTMLATFSSYPTWQQNEIFGIKHQEIAR